MIVVSTSGCDPDRAGSNPAGSPFMTIGRFTITQSGPHRGFMVQASDTGVTSFPYIEKPWQKWLYIWAIPRAIKAVRDLEKRGCYVVDQDH